MQDKHVNRKNRNRTLCLQKHIQGVIIFMSLMKHVALVYKRFVDTFLQVEYEVFLIIIYHLCTSARGQENIL